MRDLAILLLVVAVVALAVIWAGQHRGAPLAMAMVNTAQGKEAAANHLFSPCPLSPQNVRILKPEIKT